MQDDGSEDHLLSCVAGDPVSRRSYLQKLMIGLGVISSCRHTPVAAGTDDSIGTLHTIVDQYSAQLGEVRRQNGGSRAIPAVRWFLFGCGNRRKLLYRDGKLSDARTGELLYQWDVAEELIVPPVATILLTLKSGDRVRIVEDEQSLWLTQGQARKTLCSQPVKLPSFAGNDSDLVLKTLHHEILIHCIEGRPLPNFFSADPPHYRDAAMMATVLKQTGNLNLIRDWIVNLREPFDCEPGGEQQADNLGQVLYLVSLVSDRNHPVVDRVLNEIPRLRMENHISGITDGATHPVYQTAWLKFGLKSLGLEDPFQIPAVEDPFGALFWMDFRDAIHDRDTPFIQTKVPAMTWASDHAHNTRNGPLADRDFPLTWGHAQGTRILTGTNSILQEYSKVELIAPNSWHAAEAFLRLLS